MTFPRSCPLIRDGVPGMHDTLEVLYADPGFLFVRRVAYQIGRVSAVMQCEDRYAIHDVHHEWLKPLTPMGAAMLAIARQPRVGAGKDGKGDCAGGGE